MPHPSPSLRRTALSGASIAATIVVLGPVGAQALTPAAAAPATAAQGTPEHRASTASSVAVPVAPAARRAVTGLGSPDDAQNVLAELPSRRTKDFGMLGVTWDRGTGTGSVTAQVRTLSRGTWSGWKTLEVDDDGEPGTRAGTEPLWVGAADGVATRVRSVGGRAPSGIRTVLVDPGTDPAGASTGNARSSAARADGSPTYTAQPRMISRAAWGARRNTYCDSPRTASHTTGVIFHHTAGSNRYSKAQSRGIVRSTQTYHMQGRGWCDIGYNFLVDKYGQTFVGRSGGVLNQVRGAHAGNKTVNTYAMGVSMMGNLQNVRPSAAMKTATVKLIGWRLGTNYLPAKGTYAIAGHRLHRIAGHRDVSLSGIRPATATACPGRYGVAWMRAKGGLRDRVAAYIKDYSTPIKTKAKRLGTSRTGYLRVGEYPTEGGRKTIFTGGALYSKGSLGAHFVSGTIKTEYAAWRIQHGALGFPSSDVVVVTAGAQAYQHFQHGTIYRVPQANGKNKSFGLTSGVDAEYRRLGAFTSDLGAPTSRASTADGVDSATFEHGRIDYDRATGVATVTYD
jgi:uncharacterized protein with LGFP repeats